MEREEGEMSTDGEDNSMSMDCQKSEVSANDVLTVVHQPEKRFLETLEKTDASKLEKRAKRFGLDLSGNKNISQKQIDELYQHLSLKGANERHLRFDTVHLRGVTGLTTREIFKYLEDYRPVSLEWIDNTSCNVICQDHISAALAILVHSRDIDNNKIKNTPLASTAYYWREGLPHPKQDIILFRFATKSDKKDEKLNDFSRKQPQDQVHLKSSGIADLPSKNPWGDLCQSWGVYDHQEIIVRKEKQNNFIEPQFESEEEAQMPQIRNKNLAKRLGKRPQVIDDSADSDSENEWRLKSKVPRMRMHADDEELLTKRKKTKLISAGQSNDTNYSSLSIEIVNSEDRRNFPSSGGTSKLSEKFSSNVKSRLNHKHLKSDIQSRLGVLPPTNDEQDSNSADSSSDDSDVNVLSKVQKAPAINNKRSLSSVWTRLDNIPDIKIERSDLRQTLQSKNTSQPTDLRKKIGTSRRGRSPLRIEIDNDYCDSD